MTTYSEAVCHTGQHEERVYIQCLYSAMSGHTQSAQTWITPLCLQITPCLTFVSQAFTRWRHS